MSIIDLIEKNIEYRIDRRGHEPTTLNIWPLLNSAFVRRALINSLSEALVPLRKEHSIYFGFGTTGNPLGLLMAEKDQQEFVSIRRRGVLEGSDVIHAQRILPNGNWVAAELHSNELRKAIDAINPSGPVSAFVIDDKMMSGVTAQAAISLLRSKRLRAEIGCEIRIDGLAFVAEQQRGRINLWENDGIRDDQIVSLIRYKEGIPGQRLEVDTETRKARARFPSITTLSGRENFRPNKSRFPSVNPRLIVA